LVDVEPLSVPTTLDEPPAFLVADEPPPTSRYRPRRASSRRATGKPNALDVERPGAPLLPSTSATTLDERPGVSSSTSSRRATTLVDVEPLDERQRPSAPGSDNRE